MTDEDRKLLTLAAKAGGFKVPPDRPSEFDMWNPLEDDGDAFRLAVKLGLELVTNAAGRNKTYVINNSDDIHTTAEDHGSDPYAATRRSIVRAAASIGEQA